MASWRKRIKRFGRQAKKVISKVAAPAGAVLFGAAGAGIGGLLGVGAAAAGSSKGRSERIKKAAVIGGVSVAGATAINLAGGYNLTTPLYTSIPGLFSGNGPAGPASSPSEVPDSVASYASMTMIPQQQKSQSDAVPGQGGIPGFLEKSAAIIPGLFGPGSQTQSSVVRPGGDANDGGVTLPGGSEPPPEGPNGFGEAGDDKSKLLMLGAVGVGVYLLARRKG